MHSTGSSFVSTLGGKESGAFDAMAGVFGEIVGATLERNLQKL